MPFRPTLANGGGAFTYREGIERNSIRLETCSPPASVPLFSEVDSLRWERNHVNLIVHTFVNESRTLPLTWPRGGALAPSDTGTYICVWTCVPDPWQRTARSMPSLDQVRLHVVRKFSVTCKECTFLCYFCTTLKYNAVLCPLGGGGGGGGRGGGGRGGAGGGGRGGGGMLCACLVSV